MAGIDKGIVFIQNSNCRLHTSKNVGYSHHGRE